MKRLALTLLAYIIVVTLAHGAVGDKSSSTGTGTPGGSSAQVQFNNSGSFAGDSGMTYNSTTDVLTVTGGVAVPANSTAAQSVILKEDTDDGTNTHIQTIPALGADRTVTWPDASGTPSLVANTETLTNKTIDADDNTFADFPLRIPCTLLNPADGDDPLVDEADRNFTITRFSCLALGGGTISVDIQECDANGANCSSTGATVASCGATKTIDTTFTDASIASGNTLKMVVGAPTGTVEQVLGVVSRKEDL